MKKARKLITFILTVVMVLSMSMNVWAATITINDEGATNSVYSAYRLLDATDGSDGSEGDTITKIAYTVNTDYREILQQVTGKTEDADIIKYIDDLDNTDENDDTAAAIRNFADAVFEKVKDKDADAVTTKDDNETPNVNEGATNKVFENIEQGYYLIVESELGEGDDAETKSLVMLDTAGKNDIAVTTKEDEPTINKVIDDGSVDGVKYVDAAIGDSIDFIITGEVSEMYADYESYYYKITDTLSAGLTLNNDVKVYAVKAGEEKLIADNNYIYEYNNDNNSFTITTNLKEISSPTIDENTTIVVKYSATLNGNAVSGNTGNTNKVQLEYEKNPYNEKDNNSETPDKPIDPEDIGTTPEDVNVVFTFDVIVDKTDGATDEPLTGAGFTLYKQNSDGSSWPDTGIEITGKTTFEFTGLDEGTYKLVETTVPDGYNKADDIIFNIVPTYTETPSITLTRLGITDASGNTIGEFVVNISDEKSTATVNIENNTGSELPSTGGIGTTIFYIVGGALVLFAVVLLVTKKRMKNEQ